MSISLDLEWTFGFNKDIINGVHNLQTEDRGAIFFISSQYGVIYDFEQRSQIILQGHCNAISCCCSSKDKRWVVTADKGEKSIVVVWDSKTGVPVKTIFHPLIDGNGVISIDISSDSLYLATLSINVKSNNLELGLWAWTQDDNVLLYKREIAREFNHHSVRFNQNDPKDLATWGSTSISFWTWNNYSLETYNIPLSKFETGSNIGLFTSFVFLNNNGNAVTCTTEGYIILWEASQNLSNSSLSHKKATKILKLVENKINVVTVVNKFVVIGCIDGSVRFYDFYFRLASWFEDLCAGPINSISFSEQDDNQIDVNLKFWSPDFIVSTSEAFIIGVESSMFDEVLVENRRGTLLLQGMSGSVLKTASHSKKTIIAFVISNGTIQLWNYELKLLLNLREFISSNFDNVRKDQRQSNGEGRFSLFPNCLAFQLNGNVLAVGFSNGCIKLLDVDTLLDISTFAPSSQEICDVNFSSSGQYLACYDNDRHVMIFKRLADGSYDYVGRSRAHFESIIGISFGTKEKVECLISVSKDGSCVEYDLAASSVDGGVVFTNVITPSITLDTLYCPTCLQWYPYKEGDVEDKFILALNSFKIKEYNADSKHCRKTTLSPTLTGEISKLLPIQISGKINFMAYITSDKVFGVVCLPFTGNPSKRIGITGHPGYISDLGISFDGNFIFTSGGNDMSVNMWKFTFDDEILTTDDISNYVDLLEGRYEGKLYNDIVDYFYYCQIKTEGESNNNTRKIIGKIPLDQIPFFMRALGFYPTESEIENLVNEIRYGHFLTSGVLQEETDLNELIRLFINHKPVVDFTSIDLVNAFEKIREQLNNVDELSWKDIKLLIQSVGEMISSEDLETLLQSFQKYDSVDDSSIVDSSTFVDLILS